MESIMKTERYENMELEAIALNLQPTLTDEEREFLLDTAVLIPFKSNIRVRMLSEDTQREIHL
jgi:hypothetical protein